MQLDRDRTRGYLQAFDFSGLFIEELGWDYYDGTLRASVDECAYVLTGVAEKHGMAVLECPVADGETGPDYATRRNIDRHVGRTHHEHLIIYTSRERGEQIWQWVKREAGKPSACREHRYHRSQPGDALIEKLQTIAFTLDEEEQLTLFHVESRVRAAFDVEKVTKRFYDRFKKEHDAFLDLINGIPDADLERWYASVMLNRLMFIYFVQKKGFLDGDIDYLRTRLAQVRQTGPDRFYRHLLCPLFFEGFACKETDRSPKTNRLLGRAPYLNGGLFLRHQIEFQHGEEIQIPDAAFERLFGFFEEYQWHLDDRPLRDDNEINPDVLGYIFEKYINQKQMGAYYTKEDITEYITRSTVIPRLLDMVRKDCRVTQEQELGAWRLLQADPDRYLHEAVRRGVIDAAGVVIPESDLPEFVQTGMHDAKARMFDRRYNLGEADLRDDDDEKLTLPTETWREYVERRKRCLEVRAKLQVGDVRRAEDLITFNLDIRRFAQDVIENCEDPKLLSAFWNALNEITVLDPTCGSGAFLFAALNILEPLYEACLDRMEAFLDELDSSGEKHRPEKLGNFRTVLARVAQHPNRSYFIFKSIIINNLYGVDIMEEAVEICKLRLFLKLAAQVGPDPTKPNLGVEPLPDIDFNIRAGNTLVGYATYEDARKAVTGFGDGPAAGSNQGKLDVFDAMQPIKEKAEEVERLSHLFRQQQTELGGEVTPQDKQALRDKLRELEDELNRYLAAEYEPGLPSKRSKYQRWLASHRPYHWFVEFYGIMKGGGFDVVVGNPPYVEYKDIRNTYAVTGFETIACGDLYALCTERTLSIVRATGRVGLIVPISIFGTDGFSSLQTLSLRSLDALWVSCFANRPSQLFDGAQKRLTILLARCATAGGGTPTIHTTRYLRWQRDEFGALFGSRVGYVDRGERFLVFPAALEKLGAAIEVSAFVKMASATHRLAEAVDDDSNHRVFYTRKFGYFLGFLDFVPRVEQKSTGKQVLPSELKHVALRRKEHVYITLAALSSSSFFWFWNALSDCRNLNKRDVLAFPGNPESLSLTIQEELVRLGRAYIGELHSTSRLMTKSGLRIETFDYAAAKPTLDEIDCCLARHFGFTDEELDFIINYDIKYRMGTNTNDDD